MSHSHAEEARADLERAALDYANAKVFGGYYETDGTFCLVSDQGAALEATTDRLQRAAVRLLRERNNQ